MDEKPATRRSIFAVWRWKWWVWFVVLPIVFVAYLASSCPAKFAANWLWTRGLVSYETRGVVFVFYGPADTILYSNDFLGDMTMDLWIKLEGLFQN